MRLSKYIFIWLVFVLTLSLEYFFATRAPHLAPLQVMGRALGIGAEYFTTKQPGRPFSLLLGWAGFSFMLATNIYVALKRMTNLKYPKAKLAKQFNFHIFCGLLGPTLIVFHCNFKVGGLVALSFWSMIIVAGSGIVGRYLYSQLLRGKRDLQHLIDNADKLLKRYQKDAGDVSDEMVEDLKARALRLAGGGWAGNVDAVSFPVALMQSLIGDLRLLFSSPKSDPSFPTVSREVLEQQAVARRQIKLMEPLQRLFGYWHTFHLPFAYLMWIAALCHVVAALVFAVEN